MVEENEHVERQMDGHDGYVTLSLPAYMLKTQNSKPPSHVKLEERRRHSAVSRVHFYQQ